MIALESFLAEFPEKMNTLQHFGVNKYLFWPLCPLGDSTVSCCSLYYNFTVDSYLSYGARLPYRVRIRVSRVLGSGLGSGL